MSSDEVAAQYKSAKTVDRIEAVNRMKRLPVPDRIPLLLKAIRDKSNFVATMAAEQLGLCADYSATNEMLERFLWLSEAGDARDPGCHIRSHIAFAFGRLEHHAASEALKLGIRTVQIEGVGGVPFDTAAQLRGNCALALAQLHDREAVLEIAPLMFDMTDRMGKPNPYSWRVVATEALVRTGEMSALIPIVIKLRYPGEEVPEVLQECLQAVVSLESRDAVAIIQPYLHNEDMYLASFAALMLAQTRKPEVPELIFECIQRFKGDALKAAVLALASLREADARKVLYRLAEDDRKDVRVALREALASSEIEADVELLKKMDSV